MTAAAKGGVKAPPQRALIHISPCARLRSRSGSQMVNILVRFGKQPASPAPKKNRAVTRETKFQAQPVAAVKNDHHSTMRRITRRGPIQSPRKPPGISNRAYAKPKAVRTQPFWIELRSSSFPMYGRAKEIATRSM